MGNTVKHWRVMIDIRGYDTKPRSPIIGDLFVDSSNDHLLVFDGSIWTNVGQSNLRYIGQYEVSEDTYNFCMSKLHDLYSEKYSTMKHMDKFISNEFPILLKHRYPECFV